MTGVKRILSNATCLSLFHPQDTFALGLAAMAVFATSAQSQAAGELNSRTPCRTRMSWFLYIKRNES